MTERIVAAAIRLSNGLVLSLPQPARHGAVIQFAAARGLPTEHLRHSASTQGFITSEGRFVDREEAWNVARAANQPKLGLSTGAPVPWPEQGTRVLFSEDLW